MIDPLLHHALSSGVLDLALLVFGFGMGLSTKLRTPLMLTMFLIKVIKWWIATHPHGKELAQKTTLDDELDTIVAKTRKEEIDMQKTRNIYKMLGMKVDTK